MITFIRANLKKSEIQKDWLYSVQDILQNIISYQKVLPVWLLPMGGQSRAEADKLVTWPRRPISCSSCLHVLVNLNH